jgi:hypothetical protein
MFAMDKVKKRNGKIKNQSRAGVTGGFSGEIGLEKFPSESYHGRSPGP